MPYPCVWVRNLATHEPDTIVSRVRLNLDQRGAGARPCRDGGPSPDGGTNGREIKVRGAAHRELAIRDVVIHVALTGMVLAPDVFMRGHILRFSEVGRALIKVLV